MTTTAPYWDVIWNTTHIVNRREITVTVAEKERSGVVVLHVWSTDTNKRSWTSPISNMHCYTIRPDGSLRPWTGKEPKFANEVAARYMEATR